MIHCTRVLNDCFNFLEFAGYENFVPHPTGPAEGGPAEGGGWGTCPPPPPNFFENYKELLRKSVFGSPLCVTSQSPHFESSSAVPILKSLNNLHQLYLPVFLYLERHVHVSRGKVDDKLYLAVKDVRKICSRTTQICQITSSHYFVMNLMVFSFFS